MEKTAFTKQFKSHLNQDILNNSCQDTNDRNEEITLLKSKGSSNISRVKRLTISKGTVSNALKKAS